MLRPWTHSKKLCRACGGNPRAARTRHTVRGLVPRRDAGGPKEQAHLSLGQEGFTPPCRPRSKDPIDLPVWCGREWIEAEAGGSDRIDVQDCELKLTTGPDVGAKAFPIGPELFLTACHRLRTTDKRIDHRGRRHPDPTCPLASTQHLENNRGRPTEQQHAVHRRHRPKQAPARHRRYIAIAKRGVIDQCEVHESSAWLLAIFRRKLRVAILCSLSG